MDKYETNMNYNMGEACVESLWIKELADLVIPKDAIGAHQ